ncbi:hypothetical protein EDC04DRAFT_2906703 [Pisolithus marmoratus]|nr:hypothetical protein EDC04DRAFT_2906703 [Pisolithus marmoratus]
MQARGIIQQKKGVSGNGDTKLVEPTTFTLIHPIFMSYGLKGRGTCIWLVQDALEHYYILKDCWLPTTWANDVTIHNLLQDQLREEPHFALEVRGTGYEAIFSDKDEYHIFNDLLFEEKNYPSSLKGIPTLVCWDEVQRPDGAGALVPETTAMLLGHPFDLSASEHHEDCQHLRAAFLECGIGITWFSCVREFFNVVMGVVVGHFNGYLQILKPKPEFVIPDWPEGKDLKWQRDNSCFVTGTFPFQAIQIMAWEAELPWAGLFMGHSIQHDLEAIMWLVWVLCINLDGPFNKRRFKSKSSKAEGSQVGSGSSTLKSQKNKPPVSSLPGSTQEKTSAVLPVPTPTNSKMSVPLDKPPCWACPGLHTEMPREVAWLKSGMSRQKALYTTYLSPYFSRHLSVMHGFLELVELFAWGEGYVEKNVTNLPPAATMYKAVTDILKRIRDGITPELDGPPTKEEIARAQKEFLTLWKRGHLETLLLGNWAGPLQSQAQTKKRSLGNEDD